MWANSRTCARARLSPTLFILFLGTGLLLSACQANVSSEPTRDALNIPPDRGAQLAGPTPTPSAPILLPPTVTAIPAPSPTPTTPLPVAAVLPTVTLLPFPSPTPAAASRLRAEIIAAKLNVRQGPGVTYPVIGAASKGEGFDVIGLSSNKNWLQIVTAEGNPGWISAQPTYIRILGSLADALVAQAPVNSQLSPVAGQQAANPGQPVSTKATSAGKIVFTSSSGGDLYLINGDGTGLRRLAGGVIDPVASPDQRQVAFTRWDGAEFGALYTLNLDDGSERVILGDLRQPKSPTWSPDGQQIIVSFQYGGRRDPRNICRTFDSDDGMNLPEIGEITKIHAGSNGVTICFIPREDLQWRLRRINVATGQFEDIPSDTYTYNPAWDPQNPWRVIYDGDKGLVQLDVTNGQLWPITTDLRDTGPVFSPDSKKLAVTYKQHDHWEVYTLDLVTGARQRLTKPPLLADPQYNSAAPAWSPDGFQIAFVTDRSGRWEIWLMNADGSNQRPLFSPEMQAWLGLQYQGVNERMLNWIQ